MHAGDHSRCAHTYSADTYSADTLSHEKNRTSVNVAGVGEGENNLQVVDSKDNQFSFNKKQPHA